MPSLGSKVTLAVSSLITGGTIYYVHFKQVDDRVQLRKGIEMETERRSVQKQINLARLQEQDGLTKSLRNGQN